MSTISGPTSVRTSMSPQLEHHRPFERSTDCCDEDDDRRRRHSDSLLSLKEGPHHAHFRGAATVMTSITTGAIWNIATFNCRRMCVSLIGVGSLYCEVRRPPSQYRGRYRQQLPSCTDGDPSVFRQALVKTDLSRPSSDTRTATRLTNGSRRRPPTVKRRHHLRRARRRRRS
jgi:hypothetical protein